MRSRMSGAIWLRSRTYLGSSKNPPVIADDPTAFVVPESGDGRLLFNVVVGERVDIS